MSDLVKARMKRAFVIHWKERTAWAAVCGVTPKDRGRTGWFFAPMDAKVNCLDCERVTFKLQAPKP